MAFISAVMLFAVSCQKKEVKKIIVDNQFALSLFSDTISLKQILNDMDSTTQNWLRVKDDVIYAYYSDTVKDVLKASDLLSDIADLNISSNTSFTMPGIAHGEPSKDTTLFSENFSSFEFNFDGFDIDQVILRGGDFYFDFEVTPMIPMLKRIEVFSNQVISPDDEPLRIVIDYDKGRGSVNLAGYTVIPDEDNTVSFSSYVTFHYDQATGFDGGNYNCNLTGGLYNVKFKTVYGTVEHPLDSIFDDHTAIDFGINGLSGTAMLPVPTINLTYKNTFGFGAIGRVTKLKFVNGINGYETSLLAGESVEVTVNPTVGEWHSSLIEGFTDQIDALAGYTRLEFAGEVTMDLGEGGISVSDTSAVDVVANVEMPFTFDIDDLRYYDTIAINLAGEIDPNKIDDYFDKIDFFIDYNSNIKLNVTLQAEFLRNGVMTTTLFDDDNTIYYDESQTGEIRTITCTVTGDKLRKVLRANNMVLKLGVETPGSGTVTMLNTDNIFLRMRILTKTTEVDIDDVF